MNGGPGHETDPSLSREAAEAARSAVHESCTWFHPRLRINRASLSAPRLTTIGGMRVFGLLGQPVPLALWAGQLCSAAGDRLYGMAVLWLVFQLTGSANLMATVSLATWVPYIVVGFLGAGLISRSRRLRAMIRIDLLSAAFVVCIPCTFLLGMRSFAILVSVAAALSALEALFAPALQAVLPDLVSRDSLQPMIALTDSTDRLARVIGPGSAGLILLVLPEIHLFTLDAASFIVSAGALAFVARHIASSERVVQPSDDAPSRLLDGWHEVASNPAVRTGVAVRVSCNLLWTAFTIGLPFELVHRLHAGLGDYGLLLGVFGAGNLVGTVLSGARFTSKQLVPVFCAAWSLVGVGMLTLALAPSLAVAVVATAWMGVCTPLANVSMDTYIAAVVPPHRLARVYALQRVGIVGASAIGVFVVALLIDLTSGSGAIAVSGAWMIVVGLSALIAVVYAKP